MPGIFVQTTAFTLAATASGLAEDMTKGLIDRFRSLPISRSALVFGRTLGDGTLNIVVLFVMGTAGSFPSEHPLAMSLIYMVVIMAIFIPLSVHKYKNATKK